MFWPVHKHRILTMPIKPKSNNENNKTNPTTPRYTFLMQLKTGEEKKEREEKKREILILKRTTYISSSYKSTLLSPTIGLW